jgi:hypothetical protein
MKLEIRLHVGAHKTATTHTQQMLLNNRQRLAEAGVCYIELQRLRQIFTRPITRIFRDVSRATASSSVPTLRAAINGELTAQTGQFQTLVLSDECLMGNMPSLARTGKLYGNRRNRLELVKKVFEGCPITVVFTTRNYIDFYPSAYAQVIKLGGSVTYPDFLRRLDFESNTWRAIVSDLSQIFGPGRVRLFRYEDYPANLERMLENIIGRKLALDIDAARIVYPSLNSKGIDLLLATGPMLSIAERKRLGFYLANDFVFDRDYGKPSIEDGRLRNLLERLYQQDKSELAAFQPP